MSAGLHYTVDEKQKTILITDDGYEAAEDVLGVRDLRDPCGACSPLPRRAGRSLQAPDADGLAAPGMQTP
jgi:hypothetical protein